MTAVLLDTHVWAWTLTDRGKITGKALAAIEDASSIFISPISFYEITQKVKELSSEKILLTEGALYPMLHKMEAQGILMCLRFGPTRLGLLRLLVHRHKGHVKA